MTLQRIDAIQTDDHGRPLRRVTRYVERGAGGARVGVAVPAQVEPGPAGLASDPGPSGLDQAGGEIDLDQTETVRGLRREIAELAAAKLQIDAAIARLGERLEAIARRPMPTPAPPIERAPVDLTPLQSAQALLDRRVDAIEQALGALGAMGAAAAAADAAKQGR